MRCCWVLIAISITIILVMTAAADDENEHKMRIKRQINGVPLVYPYGAIYKLIIGFSTPIKAVDYISLAFVANFQYQYMHFSNITQVSQYYFIKTVSREQREADLEARRDERLTFYKSIANMLRSKGFEGEECVLRAICEAAQYPVEEEGFLGEIIHVLLTPDYGKSPFDDNKDQDLDDLMSPYTDAAVAGRQMFNCPSIYSGCPEGHGIMEMISTLREE